MAGQKNLAHRRAARPEKALELKEEREKRTDKQQIAKLDKVLGEGLGATRERKRLEKRISDNKSEQKKGKKSKSEKSK